LGHSGPSVSLRVLVLHGLLVQPVGLELGLRLLRGHPRGRAQDAVHGLDAPANRALLRRAFDALVPGGCVLVVEEYDPERRPSGAVSDAFMQTFSLNMFHNLMTPLIMGRTVRVHPLAVLLVILVALIFSRRGGELVPGLHTAQEVEGRT
jgi:hypothetical protein